MVRGCQKKIIYLKNTQSDLFDEAYFVIKNNIDDVRVNECDMVEEANRILEESFFVETQKSRFKTVVLFFKKNIIPFLVGIIISGIVMLIIM